jgi:hypothetical protein
MATESYLWCELGAFSNELNKDDFHDTSGW